MPGARNGCAQGADIRGGWAAPRRWMATSGRSAGAWGSSAPTSRPSCTVWPWRCLFTELGAMVRAAREWVEAAQPRLRQHLPRRRISATALPGEAETGEVATSLACAASVLQVFPTMAQLQKPAACAPSALDFSTDKSKKKGGGHQASGSPAQGPASTGATASWPLSPSSAGASGSCRAHGNAPPYDPRTDLARWERSRFQHVVEAERVAAASSGRGPRHAACVEHRVSIS